ncbi:2-oxoglutarate and iron-dependent oxygenase JMJD4-like [Zingiber officinale]|uniref:2-oxoglutarate and iron-dependent oxygenase JMJD4-like n=1 Tax=Zingiber officinale TaxID=94328 RepID=UPI001C4B842F|nr:2-oxoglutarate and iron-dependent oxygenase JMJD4-like [Zingiber officinale]
MEPRKGLGRPAVAISGEVERIDGRTLSYDEFVERYLKPNRPVVLTGLMDDWRAAADWLSPDGRGPNLHFFADHFGKSVVQVADCSTKEFTDQKRQEMTVAEFISYWLKLSLEKGRSVLCNDESKPLLYLKDWHFNKEYPDYVAYTTPPFFTDDWLNLYLDSHLIHRDSDIHRDKNEANCADYRFVYMGPKGTWTPLHADVFRSYSWSGNVCGRKHWFFLPPSQCHLVFDRYLRSSVYSIYDDVSEKKFPGFRKTIWLECIQEQNEIVFVPSGWYHQVHNLEDTISINHNWFNAYNLSWVWNLLLRDYNVAKEYIEDIRDICDNFEGLCQRNLAANTGMNFYDFMIFITRFTLGNIVQLFHLRHEEGSLNSSVTRSNLFIANLISVRSVATKMKFAEAFTEENINSCSEENLNAFSIQKIMHEREFQDLSSALRMTYECINTKLKEGSLTEITRDSETDSAFFDFITSLGSKIHGPGDLVGLIDRVLEKTNCSNCNINIPCDAEPFVV